MFIPAFSIFWIAFSIPVIESKLNGHQPIRNSKTKKEDKHSAIVEDKNTISRYEFDNNKENDNTYTANGLLKKLPFVSIIVPARNEEKDIERCLLSLLAQDYPHFEIIAVDDNSEDSTLKTMKDVKNKTNRKKGFTRR